MSDNERAEISQDYLVNPTFPMSKADILAIVAEAERSAAAAPPPGTRLILAHENLLDEWGTRTEDGRRITVEWGEPDEHGWYTPTFRHERSAGAAPIDVEVYRDALARCVEALAFAAVNVPWDNVQEGVESMVAEALYPARALLEGTGQ